MPNPIKCDICGKPATVHLTQIINNQIHKVDLCEACAQEKGVTDPSGFSLADLLVSAALNQEPAENLRCEHCGFTAADFKRLGRFGCPLCYNHFKPLLDSMLPGMHKGTSHIGKVPRKSLERQNLRDRIAGLQARLDEAVKAERYEDAARYRDEISQVRQSPVA